jgi:phosphoglucomutase
MLRAMADTEGFHYNETLTGFKWLGNRAITLEKNGYDVAYAFEEAIGYMFSPIVHDKDGIAAASVFLTMARQWAKEGFTVCQKLEQLYQKYGYFEAANSYFASPDPLVTKEVFAAIRKLGDPHPAKIGNRDIIKWRDLTVGYDSSTQNREPELPVSKNSEMITVELENGVRFTVRASGTEPKIKMYIECSASSSGKAKAGAQEVSEALTKEWFRPAQTGLKLP